MYFIDASGRERHVASPMAVTPKPARRTCLLTSSQPWGQGIAQVARSRRYIAVRAANGHSRIQLRAVGLGQRVVMRCDLRRRFGGRWQNYAFALSYRHKCRAAARPGPCWRFSMPDSQRGGPVFVAASIPGSAKTGEWVQLTGVFNATQGIMTLYVNNTQAAHASAPPGLSYPSATFRLGNLGSAGTDNTGRGELSNICVFYGDLQPSDVKLLYTGNAAHPRNGCAAQRILNARLAGQTPGAGVAIAAHRPPAARYDQSLHLIAFDLRGEREPLREQAGGRCLASARVAADDPDLGDFG